MAQIVSKIATHKSLTSELVDCQSEFNVRAAAAEVQGDREMNNAPMFREEESRKVEPRSADGHGKLVL